MAAAAPPSPLPAQATTTTTTLAAAARRPHILLALTGSVAALKAPLLFQELSRHGLVKVVCTESAKHFFDVPAFRCLVNETNGHADQPSSSAANDNRSESAAVEARPAGRISNSNSVAPPGSEEWSALLGQSFFEDADEWRLWNRKGDPVLHIQLRQWADLFVVAPLDANSLAKLAHGLCDNLVTCVARAWELGRPWLVAPAMNDRMWDHPFTAAQLEVLRSQLFVEVVQPVRKLLACNVEGMGAMASPEGIAEAVAEALRRRARGPGTPAEASEDAERVSGAVQESSPPG